MHFAIFQSNIFPLLVSVELRVGVAFGATLALNIYYSVPVIAYYKYT